MNRTSLRRVLTIAAAAVLASSAFVGVTTHVDHGSVSAMCCKN